MWHLLRLIDTPVAEPQNEFTLARAPTVIYDSEVPVTMNHEFNETFQSDQYDGKTSGKVELHNLVARL